MEPGSTYLKNFSLPQIRLEVNDNACFKNFKKPIDKTNFNAIIKSKVKESQSQKRGVYHYEIK